MRKKPQVPIGEMLIESGVITQEQLEEALEEQKSNNAKIGEVLVQLGYATEDKIFLHLAQQLNIPYMSLKARMIDAKVLKLISGEIVRKYNIIPIDKIGKFITIATSNPLDDEVCAEVGKITGLIVQKVASTKKDIREAIERYYCTPNSENLTEDNQPAEQTDTEIKLEEIGNPFLQEEPEEDDDSTLAPTDSLPTQQDMKDVEQTVTPIAVGKIPTPARYLPVSAQRVETTILGESFVPEYTFDNLIMDSNAETLQAAIHLCNTKQILYNPLLIYAEGGLGKTHLLHAIGNNITRNAPQKKIKFINCRELSLCIMNAPIYEFCAKLCTLWRLFDILLFDDFHTLFAEKSNQEAFIFIFDFLCSRGKQMVIASESLDVGDCEIEASLLSRIEGGLTVEIKPPNFETRLKMLHKWEEVEGDVRLSDAALNNIAEQTHGDVYQLLAAHNKSRFQKLLSYAEQKSEPIGVETLKESDNKVSTPVETTEQQIVEDEEYEAEEIKQKFDEKVGEVDVNESAGDTINESTIKQPRLATLTFTSGSRVGSVVEITQWETSIGRSGDIQVVDKKKPPIPLISRKHALLKFDPESNKYEINDTSKHGTAINDELLEGRSRLLNDGDIIQLVKLGVDRYLIELKLEYQE